MAELNRQVSKKPEQTWQELRVPRVAGKRVGIGLGVGVGAVKLGRWGHFAD